jgi:glucose/mannose transport system substrate-binding protein
MLYSSAARARAALCAGYAALLLAAPSAGGEIEVLHHWDLGADARAAALLASTLKKKGHIWKDFAVAGSNSLTVSMLRARVLSGNAPSAAQIKAPVIQQWAREGMLADIDAVAQAEHWDNLLPKAVRDAMKHKGSYVAVPTNVHRINWLWINAQVLKRSGANVPSTWDEFFVTAEAMKRAGFVPLAHGSQPWENGLLLANVALSVGGVDFYRQALVELDPAALSSPMMEKVLLTFKRIKPYTDRQATGRDWTLSTASVIRGEAGMQMIGDWAKPEFAEAQQGKELDFHCVPAPGTAHAFAFTVDSFAMFKVSGATRVQAQLDLASALMSPDLQAELSREKGSIPARQGADLARFDRCGKLSQAAFQAAARAHTLVPDMGMAQAPHVAEAVLAAASAYWNDDRMAPAAAMARLVAASRLR